MEIALYIVFLFLHIGLYLRLRDVEKELVKLNEWADWIEKELEEDTITLKLESDDGKNKDK
jgi:uncharacterized protein (DUF2344 family)